MTDTERRTAYIDGLRQLAAILEANADVPIPFEGGTHEFTVFAKGDAAKHVMRAFARAFPGEKRKSEWSHNGNHELWLCATLAGITVVCRADRERVCTRRVVGTKQVMRTIPARPALPEEPEHIVTETVEEIAWDCEPLLREAVLS